MATIFVFLYMGRTLVPPGKYDNRLCVAAMWPYYGRPAWHMRTLYFCPVISLYLSFFYSSPNLSGLRLDAYHTSTHGVALVRI